MIRMRTIQTIHPESDPPRTALKKADSKIWKLVEDTMINHTRKGDDQ